MQKTSRAAWSAEAGSAIISRYQSVPGGLMPALQALQENFGYIAADAIPLLANVFNISRAEVHGVATFYHDFTFTPPRARHVLKLCRAEACQSVGADGLAAAAKKKLGVDWHETTKDGAWALEPVFCLGLCACGPSALIDGEPLARVDESTLDAALKEHA